MIKEVKNTVTWTYVISDLNGEEIIGTFYEEELKKRRETLMLKLIYLIMQQKRI